MQEVSLKHSFSSLYFIFSLCAKVRDFNVCLSDKLQIKVY